MVEARLVPEEDLERAYRDALLLLTKERGPLALGDYLEFGVFNGTSLLCMYRALRALGLDAVRLFGFDSFEGLPAIAAIDSGGTWGPGQYRIPYELTRSLLDRQHVDWHRVTLVKGWFSDTLGPQLVQQHRITNAAILMIDCDLYSSAAEALTFSRPLIRDEAIVFLDDWHAGDLHKRDMGEKRAFDEFLAADPSLSCEELPFLQYNANSKVFRVFRHRNGRG